MEIKPGIEYPESSILNQASNDCESALKKIILYRTGFRVKNSSKFTANKVR